jgi:hypothetical protein
MFFKSAAALEDRDLEDVTRHGTASPSSSSFRYVYGPTVFFAECRTPASSPASIAAVSCGFRPLHRSPLGNHPASAVAGRDNQDFDRVGGGIAAKHKAPNCCRRRGSPALRRGIATIDAVFPASARLSFLPMNHQNPAVAQKWATQEDRSSSGRISPRIFRLVVPRS